MDKKTRIFLNILSSNDAPTSTYDQYPTTPSTFPQPVFQPASGQPAVDMEFPNHPTQQLSSNGFVPSDYFMQNYHLPEYPAQSRPHADSGNDPSAALVHQFSNQILGIDSGSYAFGLRAPLLTRSSGQAVPAMEHHIAAPANKRTPAVPGLFAQVPEPNPDKYGQNANNNQKKCCQQATAFFKDSVKRARERNQRQSETERRLQEPNVSQERRDQIWSITGRKEGQYLQFLRTKDKPENYQTIKVIGKGAFGEVKLVQKKANGQVYAMKSLIKTEMLQREQLAHVRSERDILAEAESPWVVKLFTTFQDAYFLYMLMEFLPGGDLMTMLIKYEVFSEDITRFYMAECILAIEAVHKLGFIHRDIKPDNILLDHGGHVKLTDFGLSTGFNRLHDNSYYQQLLQGKSNKPGDRSSVAIDQINLTVSNRSQINEWRQSRRLIAYSTV